jgi:hypothetical protein
MLQQSSTGKYLVVVIPFQNVLNKGNTMLPLSVNIISERDIWKVQENVKGLELNGTGSIELK